MIKQTDKLLAEELIKRNLLSKQQVEKVLADLAGSKDTFASRIVGSGQVAEYHVLQILSEKFGLPMVDLKNTLIDKTVISKIPVKFVWYYKFVPIKIEGKVLTIACSAPLDVKIQDELRVNLGLEPKIVLAKEADIINALKKNYGLGSETIDRILSKTSSIRQDQEDAAQAVEDIEQKSDDASITKLVNQIILEAYQKRATDIHIEPYRDKVRVRYRIDGVLVDANLPSEVKHFLLPILSRIKIMSNLSIVEKRFPQDGSTVVKVKDKVLDLRISTIPTPRGESMVVRILPTEVMLYSLDRLGIEQENTQKLRELIKKPYGIMLVTGPTGSGKTTTLYACLSEISSTERKIVTIEDPIEYEMEGVTQIQVNQKVNLTFAAGFRSILRHDPDIVMVGEIRDLETAEIAIRTALTGHLVFSTLHTNDAASGVTRLLEMGVEPFLVSSSVQAFIAQRLIRVICPKCKVEVKTPLLELKEEILQSLKIKDVEKVKVYQGKGCDYCNNTGYYGRTAIYEILEINEDIREAILEKRRADSIKQLAIKNGMRTLRQDGWKKVVNGITTPAEILNITVKDELLNQELKPENVKKEEKPSQSPPTTRNLYRLYPEDILSAKNEYDSRVYQRLLTKLDVRYQVVTFEDQEKKILATDTVVHSTVTKDISAGGLRFVSGYKIAPETILSINIQLEKNERSIECLAKVCRIEEENISSVFYIVVYYLDISSADRAKINSYVKTKLNQPQKASS